MILYFLPIKKADFYTECAYAKPTSLTMSLFPTLLNLLFPIECLSCNIEGAWLCDICRQKLNFINQDKTANLITPHLNQIYIAGDYNDPLLVKIIQKFKYDFISALGLELSLFLNKYWENIIIKPQNILVIPIPLFKKRLRWRGFNQSEILARSLCSRFSYQLSLDLLRLKPGLPQASLNEAERSSNVLNAFTWSGGDLKDKTVLLIDDVITSGATINAAALALKSAGATTIHGLILAKG